MTQVSEDAAFVRYTLDGRAHPNAASAFSAYKGGRPGPLSKSWQSYRTVRHRLNADSFEPPDPIVNHSKHARGAAEASVLPLQIFKEIK